MYRSDWITCHINATLDSSAVEVSDKTSCAPAGVIGLRDSKKENDSDIVSPTIKRVHTDEKSVRDGQSPSALYFHNAKAKATLRE